MDNDYYKIDSASMQWSGIIKLFKNEISPLEFFKEYVVL